MMPDNAAAATNGNMAADNKKCHALSDSNAKESRCRSLVLSSPRTIALHPSALHRNLHPSASTRHLRHSQGGQAYHTRHLIEPATSQLHFPVILHQLQNNTDLRLAPASPPQLPQHRPHFSSFQMAHEFVQYLRDVDVVSDAENIKELLKMPFNPKEEVSLLVHRIGPTLLLDPFSVSQLEQQRKDWDWLRHFQSFAFQKLMKVDPHTAVCKRTADLQQHTWQMMAYFLQCTVQAGQHGSQPAAPAQHLEQAAGRPPQLLQSPAAVPSSPASSAPPLMASHRKWKKKKEALSSKCDPVDHNSAIIPVTLTPAVHDEEQTLAPVMPEPSVQDQIPDDHTEGQARNIIWNFENLRMLIGTDLPIFGGDTHPCVSLRLTDMAKPINVLTGLDYWLDNLMCNVPEVAMCFHLSGLVQKYECIKTEELPELSDSKFSPALVKDIAQNILAFLKDRTTHEGHTYWLFKRKDDEVVKLYDLTSLVQDSEEAGPPPHGPQTAPAPTAAAADGCSDPAVNPFTVPAGMLFYRMAKNLLTYPETRHKTATIIELLQNAIKLLDGCRYPEIVSSAHYYIADVLMHEDCTREFESESSGEEYEDEAPTKPGQMHFPRGSGAAAPLSAKNNTTKNKNKKQQQQSNKYKKSAAPQQSGGNAGERNKKNNKERQPAPGAAPGVKGGEDRQQQQPPTITLSELCLPSTRRTFSRSQSSFRPPRLTHNFEERCCISLSHVVSGLNCLTAGQQQAPGGAQPAPCQTHDDDLQQPNTADDEPKMANSYESIPLPYQPINKTAEHCSLTGGKESMVEPPCNTAVVGETEHTSTSTRSSSTAASSTTTTTLCYASSGSSQSPPSKPQSVVLSSPCQSVHLSSVQYDVASLSSKLMVMLLHKAAVVYRILAAEALAKQSYKVAVEHVFQCIRCCYAVCLELQITTVTDATPKPQPDYPHLKQALVLAADALYFRAKHWSDAPDEGAAEAVGERKGRAAEAGEGTTRRGGVTGRGKNGGAAARGRGDSSPAAAGAESGAVGGLEGAAANHGRLRDLLDRLMPAHYRAQFDLSLSPDGSSLACMELAQCCLFLAAGGKLDTSAATSSHTAGSSSSTTSKHTANTTSTTSSHTAGSSTSTTSNHTASTTSTTSNHTASCSTSTTSNHTASTTSTTSSHTAGASNNTNCSSQSASSDTMDGASNIQDRGGSHSRQQPSSELPFEFSEEMLARNPVLLSKLAGVMNEMSCIRINLAEATCSSCEGDSAAVLQGLKSERARLELAVFLFQRIGDDFNSAITYTNLAKYHRLAAYYTPARVLGQSYDAAENTHYQLAAASYKAALFHLQPQRSSEDRKTRRRRKPKRGAAAPSGEAEDSRGEKREEMVSMVKLELADTLYMQGSMMVERLTKQESVEYSSYPWVQESAECSSLTSVVQESFKLLQDKSILVDKAVRINKSLKCCHLLVVHYATLAASEGKELQWKLWRRWMDAECLLLASTDRAPVALTLLTASCNSLLDDLPADGPAAGHEVMLREVLLLLVQSDALLLAVSRSAPSCQETLAFEAVLRRTLLAVCKHSSASDRSTDSKWPVSREDASAAYRAVLRSSNHSVGPHLLAALPTVARTLGLGQQQ